MSLPISVGAGLYNPPRRGGIENLLENLCSGLREKHRVFIVTSFAKAPHLAERHTFRAPLAGLIPFGFYVLWRGATVLARDRRDALRGSAERPKPYLRGCAGSLTSETEPLKRN